MAVLRVVLIEDDDWTRATMAGVLDADPRVELVAMIDQDEALDWPVERWNGIDLAVVDVFDEAAPAETDTDVFSGIATLDLLRDLEVRTLAITPHCQHPLVQLRIYHAKTNWLYHRWEVNHPHRLLAAVLTPTDDHVPLRPCHAVLRRHGATRAQANHAVRLYQRSPLAGLLQTEIGLKSIALPRRTFERFRIQVASTDFAGSEIRSAAGRRQVAPRWPDVRDFLLIPLGRHGAPPTEVDREDGALAHTQRSGTPDLGRAE